MSPDELRLPSEYRLRIPAVPRSVNAMALGSRAAHLAAHGAKKKWEGMYMIAFLEAKLPKTGVQRISASAVCYFKTRRRRDVGNYLPGVEKPLGDALQLYGAIPDDTPTFFEFERLQIAEETRNPPETIVYLTVMPQ